MAQNHCIPVEISRKLHHDAVRSYLQDTLIHELSGKIGLLEQQTFSIRENLTKELTIEREKNRLHSDNVEDFKKQIASHSSETAYFKKKERKSRRERNVAIVFGALAIAAAAVK